MIQTSLDCEPVIQTDSWTLKLCKQITSIILFFLFFFFYFDVRQRLLKKHFTIVIKTHRKNFDKFSLKLKSIGHNHNKFTSIQSPNILTKKKSIMGMGLTNLY